MGRSYFEELFFERLSRESKLPARIYGTNPCSVSFIISILERDFKKRLLILVEDQELAEGLSQELASFALEEMKGRRKVMLFSSTQTGPYQPFSPNFQLSGDRVATLAALHSQEDHGIGIVVAPVSALLAPTIPGEVLAGSIRKIRAGEEVFFDDFVMQLCSTGYSSVSVVEGPGEYAVRGGIIDYFGPYENQPVRLEFFGDTLESIRLFDPSSQLTLKKLTETMLIPAKEMVLPPENRRRGFEKLNELISSLREKGFSSEEFEDEVSEILTGQDFPGLERYYPYFFEKPASLLDYIGEHLLVIVERDRVEYAYSKYLEELKRDSEKERTSNPLLKEPASYIAGGLEEELVRKERVEFNSIEGLPGNFAFEKTLSSREMEEFRGRGSLIVARLKGYIEEGFSIKCFLPKRAHIERLAELLQENRLETGQENSITFHRVFLKRGSIFPEEKLILLSAREVYGEEMIRGLSESHRLLRKSKAIKSHLELSPGDYVVHAAYGIGRYRGVKLLEAAGKKNDYLYIEYAGNDKLYIPVENIDCLQKYIGLSDSPPKLNRLHDPQWKKARASAKKSIEKLSKELLELYAYRANARGFAFPEDNEWQKKLEELFPYQETPDQLKAIFDTKADMERPRPMDRLICGDVGFGKTEVAIRAAFKAVMGGKQVAVLVPTTVLALQHYNTFLSRFQAFPVRVELLSRFRSKKENRETIENLKAGRVDVVIGTHRLVQKDVQFHDLGLLIIDEEQRFGVKAKEYIKEMKKTVDVMTLSATPIPRTLHLSLSGARDISLIETPPANRLPIKTFVMAYSKEVVKEAIEREIARGGQVYYVHNRIDTIEHVAFDLQKSIPNIRVVVAHGQMDEEELERIMIEFYEHRYDVLVSTTIIENGLDIPNVNTMIIERADKLGLAQLYQLRGRVGRSKHQAYAYFFYPHDLALTDIARRRLQTIKEFSDLGSGFKIAMRDLELRGAGNVLGHEQHGHIMAIGFELFCKMLKEEIDRQKGEKVQEEIVPEIDLKVNAYIPPEYIGNETQKIDMYKRLADSRKEEELAELINEMRDRYGPEPRVVTNLLKILRIRQLAIKLKARYIQEEKKHVIVKFSPDTEILPQSLTDTFIRFPKTARLQPGDPPILYIMKEELKGENLLETIADVLATLVSQEKNE